jgi:N-acetylglucosaminyldiphosphoundecaprenol N-acetyl-beta-D-mannosaminyltransferase
MNTDTIVEPHASTAECWNPEPAARTPKTLTPIGFEPPERISLFGIEIDSVLMNQAVERVWSWLDDVMGDCRMIVTPNLDHAVMLQENHRLREAYRRAELIVADGWPLVMASRILRKSLPARVTGSDLVPALFDRATMTRPLSVFLLGAGPGVAIQAAEKIHAKWAAVQVVGTCSPPIGFEHDEEQNAEILARIAASRPDLLVVGLGAPKQELWVHDHLDQIHARAAICAGATIDFLGEKKRRAPRWVRTIGLEWCHRMCSEPRRLVRRYARDAWMFPRLLWRELFG